MTYALDTNIISYMLNDNDSVYAHYFGVLSQGNRCVIPLVVYYEIQRGLKANGAIKKERMFERLCYELVVDDLTIADMDTAADIYAECKRKGRPIDDADLLIAAQVITRGYTLVTNNIKHFEGINRLSMVNWAGQG